MSYTSFVYPTQVVSEEKFRQPLLEEEQYEREVTLYPYQDQFVFEDLYNQPYAVIVAPPGSGKSTMGLAHAYNYLVKNPDNRVIISCPQKFNATGFLGKVKIHRKNGKLIGTVEIGHDLTGEVDETKTQELLDFLKPGKRKLIKDKIALCTHALLVRAYNSPGAEKLFVNSLTIVDEVHHACS